ncbi:MAG: GNAT family N-acetyltransferase [Fervidobacterium sp.]|jgi:ribosomal protein S18 acetylase RimI-like enzyme
MEEKILTLSEYSLIDFVELVNEIFKDYVLPINWNVLSFKMDARENSVSLTDSFIFVKDKNPVGFILVAIRGNRARIDAMGVVEGERGKGLAERILKHTFHHLKHKNIETVYLEVAASDERAVRFYDKNGFRKHRELHTFILKKPEPKNIRYSTFTSDNKYVYSVALNNEIDIQRKVNWQREPITLLLADGRYNFTRFHVGNTEGYLVWGKNEDNSAFIVDLAVKSNSITDWEMVCNCAIDYLYKELNPSLISVVSVPEDDYLHTALENSGFEKVFTQYEMCRKI